MDFEMTTTTISPTDDISASVDPLMKANGRKKDNGIVGVNRNSALLTFFALLVSLIFLISSLVYVYQVKREWMGEITKLRSEFESMKQKNENYAHSPDTVRLRQETSGSEISKIKIELRQLKNTLNETDTFKQKMLDFRVELTNQIGNITEQLLDTDKDTTKEIARLEMKLEHMQNANSNHAAQLLSQIRDWNLTCLRHRDDLQDDITECRNLQLNETRQREESFHSIGQSIKNRLKSLKDPLASQLSAGTDAVASDVEQLKRVDSENFVLLENEIEERRIGETNQTANINKRMADLRAELTNQLVNLTEQLFESEKDTAEEIGRLDRRLTHIQNSYSNHTIWIVSRMQYWNRTYLKQRKDLQEDIAECRDLQLNESRKHKEIVDSISRRIQNHTASLESWIEALNDSYYTQFEVAMRQIEELHNADLSQLESLHREIRERTRAYDSLDISAQNKIDHLNTSQYTMTSQLVRLRSKVNQLPTQHQIEQINTAQSAMMSTVENQQRLTTRLNRTMKSVQNTIKYLTAASISYYTANGWKRFGSLLYKKFGESVTYRAAESTCSSHGGRLAAKLLRDAEAVRSMISSGFETGDQVWVGYEDRQTEGLWRGSDGGSIDLSVTPWAAVQPDNYRGNEDCATVFVSGNQLFLNDLSCASTQPFLCEAYFS